MTTPATPPIPVKDSHTDWLTSVQSLLATVVIAGILSSTFLTLLLLPVLYAWAEGRRQTANQAEELADV